MINGKEVEKATECEAIETKDFLLDFFDNAFSITIEKRDKTIYKIEKGDRVHWGNNTNRVDIVTDIKRDIWGNIRYATKEINGDKIGMAYEKNLTLVT
jgi:hypothetical protein